MKLRFVLLPFLFHALAVEAAVYKWIDDEGVTHFGDLPPGEVSADPVQLPQLQTYSAPAQPPAVEEAGRSEGQIDGAGLPAAGYKQVSVVAPLPDATVRSNTQQVMVQVAVEPGLRPGHMLAVILDGKPVGEPTPATQIELQGVVRGQHSIRVEIVDASGEILKTSEPVSFYLRQASVLAPRP